MKTIENVRAIERTIDLNNRLFYEYHKQKEANMESIPGYDKWKTAAPDTSKEEAEIDALERELLACPFCSAKAYFEHDSWDWAVTCDGCGVSMRGAKPSDAAIKWSSRSAPVIR